MSGVALLNPWGLLALAGVAAVAVIYLFYEHYRPVRISGLFLWDEPSVVYKGGRRLERPPIARSLLLDLAAVSLLAVGLAAPSITGLSSKTVAIILDGSLSMRAGNNHQRAVREALSILQNVGDRDDILILEADEVPHVVATPGMTSAAARKAITGFDPYSATDSLVEAVTLARDLATGPVDAHLFTDKKIDIVPPGKTRLHTHVFKGKQPNIVLTDATRYRRLFSEEETLYVSVANLWGQPCEAVLKVRSGTDEVYNEVLSLIAGSERHTSLSLPLGVGDLSIVVESSDDAIAADSTALLLPDPKGSVTFAIDDVPGSSDIARALRAAGAVDTASGMQDLLVTSDPKKSGRALTLELCTVPEAAPSLVGPFLIDQFSPLCRDVELAGVYWMANPDTRVQNRAPVLVAAGDIPLLWGPSKNRLFMNIKLDKSNLSRSPAWPVIFANLVRYCEGRLPGLRKANYLAEEVLEFVPFGNKTLDVDTIEGDGTRYAISAIGSSLVPIRPGLYRLLSNAAEIGRIAVNVRTPEESDLRGLADEDSTAVVEEAQLQETVSGSRQLGWVFSLFSLLALALNWLLDKGQRE